MKALLVSDHLPTIQLLVVASPQYGHEVIPADDPSAPWRLVRRDVDLLLLDLEDASEAHWQKLVAWRIATDLPFIALGPWNDQDDAVRALRIGADDYLPRPLRIAELIARMEARLRRARILALAVPRQEQATPDESVVLDAQTLQVRIGGRHITLTYTEFRLLETLWQRRGRPVLRQELIRLVWGEDTPGMVAALNHCIWHLRLKLEEDPAHPRLIVTHWGLGYSLEQDNP